MAIKFFLLSTVILLTFVEETESICISRRTEWGEFGAFFTDPLCDVWCRIRVSLVFSYLFLPITFYGFSFSFRLAERANAEKTGRFVGRTTLDVCAKSATEMTTELLCIQAMIVTIGREPTLMMALTVTQTRTDTTMTTPETRILAQTNTRTKEAKTTCTLANLVMTITTTTTTSTPTKIVIFFCIKHVSFQSPPKKYESKLFCWTCQCETTNTTHNTNTLRHELCPRSFRGVPHPVSANNNC